MMPAAKVAAFCRLADGLAFAERERLDGGAWQREDSRWEMRGMTSG
jgi:hypothetical protein